MDLVFGSPGHGNHLHQTDTNVAPFAQDATFTPVGTFTFDVNSNTFDVANTEDDVNGVNNIEGGVLINAANSGANASGYFRNNTIGISGTANSGSRGNLPGLDVESNGGGNLTIDVSNNLLMQWGGNGAGFLLQAGAGSPTSFSATITNNTIVQPGTFAVTNQLQGFQLNNGTQSTDSIASCVSFSGNVLNGSGSGGGGGDARFRQRFNTQVRMPGYTAGSNGTGIPAYVQGFNPTGPPAVTAVSSTIGGGGFFNTPSGGACALPNF